MRRLWNLICCTVLVALLAGCGQSPALPKERSADRPVSLLVATDLHYLSPQLTDDSDLSRRVLTEGDGRTLAYIQEVTEAFAAEVIAAAPDALLLSGDLTFNGAAVSHTDLIETLTPIREAGIPVLVIPGNHDLNNTHAASFTEDSHEPQPSMTAEEFQAAYADFGYAQAISFDELSGSYLYPVRADLWVLMLDTNSGGYSTVPKETLTWVEEQLQLAEQKGAKVIAVSHQNLLLHNPRFDFGVRIGCAKDLEALYEQYGVLCNLSGHMHMQHILDGPVPEIAASSLPLSPNQYGVLTYDGATLSYQTKALDVAAWARDRGLDNQDLLDFPAYAHDVSLQAGYRQIMASFAESDLPEADKELMAETFAVLNGAYFAGDPVDPQPLAEGLALWQEHAPSFHDVYLQRILSEAGMEHHSLTIPVE